MSKIWIRCWRHRIHTQRLGKRILIKQQFSKCGPGTSSSSDIRERGRNVKLSNPSPGLLNGNWGWGPASWV